MSATKKFIPTLDALEDRLVATTAKLSGGLLYIAGTNASDNITVRQVNGAIRVSGVAGSVPVAYVKGIVIDGYAGNDTIVISNPSLEAAVQHMVKPTLIAGGDGDDVIVGGSGTDAIGGGNGNDRIDGQWGNDLIFGGFGADEIYGNEGDDRIYGQAGNDTLYGQNGSDYLDGGDGGDWLIGGNGADLLYGGNDYLSDVFYSPTYDDVLATNYGEDYIYYPASQNYSTLQKSSFATPSTSYTNLSNKGVISQMLGVLSGGPADFVYQDYAAKRMANMWQI